MTRAKAVSRRLTLCHFICMHFLKECFELALERNSIGSVSNTFEMLYDDVAVIAPQRHCLFFCYCEILQKFLAKLANLNEICCIFGTRN